MQPRFRGESIYISYVHIIHTYGYIHNGYIHTDTYMDIYIRIHTYIWSTCTLSYNPPPTHYKTPPPIVVKLTSLAIIFLSFFSFSFLSKKDRLLKPIKPGRALACFYRSKNFLEPVFADEREEKKKKHSPLSHPPPKKKKVVQVQYICTLVWQDFM